MSLSKVFDRFVADSPVSVMFRGLLENVFAAEWLDDLFERHARQQYQRQLLFSTLVDLLSLVVAGMRKSVHAAWRVQAEQIGVSVKALYDKLSRVETAVSEALVRETTARLLEILQHFPTSRRQVLRGYDARIVDGNHLAGTDRRLRELRPFGAAPLPGLALAILDPDRELILEAITSEDGYESEYNLIPRVLAWVRRRQLWFADRGFCCTVFLEGLIDRKAKFIIRQNLSHLRWELIGKRRKLGKTATGVVYEQPMRVWLSEGRATIVRRITVELFGQTRDGEKEIHLLTNLPSKVTACRVAELYPQRWRVETAFQDLATVLRSEINTLGYPAAALFGFCLALVLYNVLSVIRTVAATTQRKQLEDRKVSLYYLADEIAGTARGMEIAIPEAYWMEAFAHLSSRQMARTLRELAQRIRIQVFTTNPWTPKRPQPKRKTSRRHPHLSTYRLLLQRTEPP